MEHECSIQFSRKIFKYQISWKSVHLEPSCSMRTDGQTWRFQKSLSAVLPKNEGKIFWPYISKARARVLIELTGITLVPPWPWHWEIPEKKISLPLNAKCSQTDTNCDPIYGLVRKAFFKPYYSSSHSLWNISGADPQFRSPLYASSMNRTPSPKLMFVDPCIIV